MLGNLSIKPDEKIPITLVAYLTVWVDGEVKNIDCQDSRSVDSKELEFYDFVAADIPIIKEFLTTIK